MVRAIRFLVLLALPIGVAAQADLGSLLKAHAAAPLDVRTCEQIGIAYTQRGDFTHAAEFFRKALAIQPDLIPARKNLATVLWFLNRRTESLREFETVLKARPADPVPHLYLGLAAHDSKRFAAASAEFKQAGELALGNPEVLPAVLESFHAAGDVVALERLASGQGGAAAYLALGDLYDKKGEAEKAYGAYRNAIAGAPDEEASYLALARFASAHRNNQYALQVVGQGLKRLPGSARLLLERGLLWAIEGDRTRSEESFRRAASADPQSNVPVLALGVSCLEHGQPAEAAARFREAAAVDPNDYRAEYLYATALSRTGRDDDPQAIAALHRAIALKPADANSHAALGKAYAATGRLDLAVPELEKALRLDRDNAAALYQLGLVYQKQGRTEAARSLLERFRAVKAKSREQETVAVQILRVIEAK